jgi:AGCS family alanine or glycine:cation symporter
MKYMGSKNRIAKYLLPIMLEEAEKKGINKWVEPFVGGVVGTMIVAMQKGVARGIFSNESGLGSAPIAAAAAKTKEPVRQGLVSMTGTFIDTIIICTMTGLSIVLTGAWQQEGLEGVQVTTYAFQEGLPISEQVAAFLLMLCLVFFAFTTILGWDYYSERCLEYLSGKNKKAILVYRWLYILAVFIGPYMTVKAVCVAESAIDFNDFFCAMTSNKC